jgi:hypothetical protein
MNNRIFTKSHKFNNPETFCFGYTVFSFRKNCNTKTSCSLDVFFYGDILKEGRLAQGRSVRTSLFNILHDAPLFHRIL